MLNYVLNYSPLGNIHCCLFRTFKMKPGLQLIHYTNELVWGINYLNINLSKVLLHYGLNDEKNK